MTALSNDLSDHQLLSRTSQGDRDAFGQLVVRHQSLICAVAFRAGLSIGFVTQG